MAIEVERPRRLFTIKDYERMFETGILTEHERVELIEGEIVKMSPIGMRHAAFVANLTRLFVHAVGDSAVVWVQGPVRLPPRSLPQPDVALLRPRSYVTAPATMADALLVIEVSDTSFRYDSTVKQRLYARAGIPEYWVIDVKREAIDVYESPSGEGYAGPRRGSRGERLAPGRLPGAAIDVAAIFV